MKATAFALLLVPLSLAGLVGCTAYTSDGFMGGYSDLRLSTNVWRISFVGNSYTSSKRVQDYALLRACDVVLKYGYNAFELLDARSATAYSQHVTDGEAHTTTTGTMHVSDYGSYGASGYLNTQSQTTYTPPQVSTRVSGHSSELIVRASTVADLRQATYDAAALQAELKKKYGIKK